MRNKRITRSAVKANTTQWKQDINTKGWELHDPGRHVACHFHPDHDDQNGKGSNDIDQTRPAVEVE